MPRPLPANLRHPRTPHRRRGAPRRGMAALYTVLLFTAVAGFVTLGADWGRVMLVKAELQRAADASARAGTSGLSTSVSSTQSLATTWAANNTADGSAVVITNSDIEFGRWNPWTKTFTAYGGSSFNTYATGGANVYTSLSGPTTNLATALRITTHRRAADGNAVNLTFGAVIGRSTCDTHAVSVTQIDTSHYGYGLVGITSVNVNGSGVVNSYNSSAGSYAVASAHRYGSLASNGTITLADSAYVAGDARCGKGSTFTQGANVTVLGSLRPQTTVPAYANVSGAPASSGNFSVTSGQTVSAPAGTYSYTNITVASGGTVNLTGAITLYVSGNLVVSGNWTTYLNRPQNFVIKMVNNGTITLNSGTTLCADIYANQSAVTITNNTELCGRIIAKTLTVNTAGGTDAAKLHYDESLNGATPATPGLITVEK